MIISKYLYLNELHHADTWINGGFIPIKLASSYLHTERSGVMTPDETHIILGDDPSTIERFSEFIKFPSSYSGISISNCSIDDEDIPSYDGSKYQEDGLILSFSNSFKISVGRRLGKSVCVKILDIETLSYVIDWQVGDTSMRKDCQYTQGHNRHPFLKSIHDSWQDEYRFLWRNYEHLMVWPYGVMPPLMFNTLMVYIPPGTAEFVAEITPPISESQSAYAKKYPARPCYCWSGKKYKDCHGRFD